MAKRKNFSELTAAGKRARVARDVLMRLDLRQIEAGSGYGSVALPREFPFDAEAELRDVMLDERTGCEACALGCLFMADVMARDRMTVRSATDLDDEVSIPDEVGVFGKFGISDDVIRRRLGNFFGRGEMAMIESAYEGVDFRGSNDASHVPYDDIATAIEFGARADKSRGEKRLRAIMQNIVEHRGNFVP